MKGTGEKHISLVLRLKLFDAMVSPAMLFGLANLPLTKGCLQKLGVVQTRMLRSIVGWVRIHDDLTWRDIMVQMNHNWRLRKLCSQWRVGKTDSSDRSFDLHIGLHAHLKDGRLNLFPESLDELGVEFCF